MNFIAEIQSKAQALKQMGHLEQKNKKLKKISSKQCRRKEKKCFKIRFISHKI